MSPKWVKGPETFLEVVQRLSKCIELYVLLTGPARGYLKAGLEKIGVPYHHVQLKRYQDVARHYWALDLYLITSRDEGGPMALLESMASGVPVVSTRVGMCADLLDGGECGVLAEVDDVAGLVESAKKVLQDSSFRATLVRNARVLAQNHDWSVIATRYYEEVYKPLLVV